METNFLGKLCSVKGCGRVHRARGYCSLHWRRWRDGTPLNKPAYYNRIAKKGWIMGGYRWISTPDRGEILEHRYKMEKHLGRILGTDELVHHKNEDKLDNRLSNLEVIARDRHTAIHRAHKMPCVVCGSDTAKSGYGVCTRHRTKVLRLLTKFGIDLPEKKFARALLLMGLAWASESPEVFERIESLNYA